MAGSVVLSVILIALSQYYVSIYQVEPETKRLARMFLIVFALLAANIMKLSAPYVYFLLSLEEVIRLGISFVIFKRRIWMKSIR